MAPAVPPKNPSRPTVAPLKPKKPSIKKVRKTGTTSTASLVSEAMLSKKSSNDDLAEEDYEDINRTAASMQLFGTSIQRDIQETHSEIKTRVESGENAAQANDTSQKLKEKLPTPPSSPDSPTAPSDGKGPRLRRTSADIAASKQRYSLIHQDLLRNETFAGLLRRDAYFSGVMNDLNGLREWWDQTRTEWRNRRAEMSGMQKTLNGLAAQKRRTEAQLKDKSVTSQKRSAKTAELARLDKQFIRQATQINEFSLWFGKTRELMDGVKLRFKELEIESKDAEIEPRPKTVVEDDFEYKLDEISAKNDIFSPFHPELPPWWKANGPVWWLDQAIEDLAQSTHDIQEHRQLAKGIKTECEQLMLHTERNKDGIAIVNANKVRDMGNMVKRTEIEIQEKYGNNTDRRKSLEDDMKVLYSWKRLMAITDKSHVWAKVGLVEALQEEQDMKDADIKSLRIRLRRIRTILRMAREARKVVAKMAKEDRWAEITAPQFVAALSIMHDIFCIEDTRNTDYMRLRHVTQNSELPVFNKKNLSILEESHFARFQRVHNSLSGFLERHADKEEMFYKMRDLYKYLESARTEMNELQQIVLEVNEILKARQLIPAKKPADPILVPSATPTTVSSVKTDNQVWGKIKSVDEARRVLAEQDNRGVTMFSASRTLETCLREFFTSPDIAPNFEHISKLTRSDFFDLVDTFVDDDYSFTPREIEAFLVYSNYTGELFKLDGNYVSPSDDGWELIDETPVGGPPRKMTLAEPPYVVQFAGWMVQNQAAFLGRLKVQDDQRDTQEDALLYVAKKYFPYDLSDEDLRAIFAYYGQSGTYFRYLPFGTDEGQPLLRRIDNGWNVDTRSKLRAIFSGPKEYFIPLRRVITSKAVTNLLDEAKKNNRQFTESELYLYLQNGLEGGLKYGGLWGIGQTEVTRTKFHLFLRWCDQFKDLFELKRRGNVYVTDSGWDQRY